MGWTASPGASSYTVKVALSSGGPYDFFTQSGITGTSFLNGGLSNGTTYFYVVSASNATGEGADSGEQSATPQLPPPPGAPASLIATAGNAQVVLSWTATGGAASYTLKRALTAGGPYDVGARDTYGDLGATVADLFGVPWDLEGTSFAGEIGR